MVKYVLEMLNKVEQVSLVHNLGALNLHCDLQGGRGQAGRISWVELGEPHVAYHWTVELIKKKTNKKQKKLSFSHRVLLSEHFE